MTDQELERRLSQALNRAAPDNLSEVLSRCGPGKGTVISMAEATKKTGGAKRWRPLIAAVLALVLLGGGTGGFLWRQANAVASIISLDVNPSIELKVNRSEKVLACTPMNEDASVILADMGGGQDLKGTKLDVAVNAIVGSLLRNGYLDSISSAILISVEDGDQARATRLQEELVSAVDTILQGANNTSSVYSQSMTPEQMSAISDVQQSAGMSAGKAALVSRVLEMSGASDAATRSALAALSVEELMDLLDTGETRVPIGMAAAGSAAEAWAGTVALDSATTDVDPELDSATPCYEVEIHTAFGEFEYLVDAFTGEVLSGQKDLTSLAESGTGGGTGTGTGQTSGGASDIGLEVAKSAALRHAGVAPASATFGKTAADQDNGRREYDIEFNAGGYHYEYEIDAETGSVLKSEKEAIAQTGTGAGTGSATGQTGAGTGDIGAEAAKSAALRHAGVSASDATVTKAQLDYDNGRAEYDVEFVAGGYKYEYEIDAASGSVLKSEKEAVSQSGSGAGTGGGTGQTGAGTGDIGAEAAKSAALQHAGVSASDATVTKAQLDYDNGRSEYDIEFVAGGYKYEYEIDATSGSVLKSEQEPIAQSGHHTEEHHTEDHNTGTTGSGDIGVEAAKQAALSHAGLSAGQVSGLKAEQDRDDGRLEYEVEFRANGYEYEYTIDAANGAILKHEKDWDD